MTYGEEGAVGGVEGLAFGVLLFALGTLMIVNMWAVIDFNMAAATASREAARAYVEASSASAARVAAEQAARDAVRGHGSVDFALDIDTRSAVSSYRRCDPVRATVTLTVPRISLPLSGGVGGEVKVKQSHTEVIDPYRSGLDGDAVC